jgi:acyl-CoA thioester hydrolase
MKNYLFSLDFKVRDYECDLQGIVNNAVYQNYLEHTRHEFIKNFLETDFALLHKQGINPVVYRIEIDYKLSLQSNDEFVSSLFFEKEGNLKIIFYQDIFRKPDNKLVVSAKVITVILKNGKPALSEAFFKTINNKKD